jgi:hypothetical protein
VFGLGVALLGYWVLLVSSYHFIPKSQTIFFDFEKLFFSLDFFVGFGVRGWGWFTSARAFLIL